MMVNPRFLSFLMPIVAGGFLLWYKKRNYLEREEKEGNDSGEGDGGGGDKEKSDMNEGARRNAPATGDDGELKNKADVADRVVLASSLISFMTEDKEPSINIDDDEDGDDSAPLPPMPSFDDNDNEILSRRQSESEIADDADLSDVEFQQKRVLDWAEERVSISEADLDADLESLLQSCFNASAVDDSPSSRRLRMRQAHAVRAGSEVSGVSSTSTSSGDDQASSSSWRLNSGGDPNALTPRSSWNSLQNTPDVKRSPRNRRLKRSGGYGDESVQSTPSGGERACPVISCTPNTPSSGVTSSGLTASPSKKDGSDCDNWREHMGQWGELARSHNTPTDRCSEISDDSGQGGSDGVPSISIASPGDIVIYEFEFPSELCGRLIGKGGRNLQQLMIETNTRLALRKQPFTEDHQIVSVTGRQEDVQSVLQSVRQKFPRHRNPEVDLRPVQMPLPQDLLVPDIMPLSLPEDSPVEVIVSAVVSTAHIFVQMPTHPTFPNLPHLDACMLACYSQNGAPPLPTPIEAGVICAAPQSGGWYRAQIVEIVPSSSTKEEAAAQDESEKCGEEEASSSEQDAYVRFVDYGGYAYVPLSSLRQIRSDFIALPFQAVECYLAYMAPPGEESFDFPIDGAFYLEQLVKDAAAAATEVGGSGLKAETVAYADGGVPCVYLYPSVGSEKGAEEDQQRKVSINEALVAHGDAKWIPYYDGGNVLGEDCDESVETLQLQQQQQQQSQDIYESSLTSSITSSSFTEDDVVSAVVFTPMAMRTKQTTSSSSSQHIDDNFVEDMVEIDVQNISQSNSGLKTITDCLSTTEQTLSSLSTEYATVNSSLHLSSSVSDDTFQLDCENGEFPKLVEVAQAVSQIAV